MLITKTTQGIVNRFKTASRRAVGRSGKLLGGKRWISALALLCALSACGTAAAQTKHEQLTIGKTTNLDSISDDYSSILFTGPYALTLRDGQTLWTVLVSKETGAVLNLGNQEIQGQGWSIVTNNPSWSGTINVLSGNSLTVSSWAANPLGAYSETALTNYATTALFDGATLTIPAKEVGLLGIPAPGEIKIGELITDSLNDVANQDPAKLFIGENQTLVVEDGLDVDPNVGLVKTGSGTLELLANGTKSKMIAQVDSNTLVEVGPIVSSFNLGKLSILDGTVNIADGAMDVDDAVIKASSIYVGDGAELDIERGGVIEIAGDPGDVVFTADDGSTVDFYIDGVDKATAYVATTYNTYMELGETTLDITSSVRRKDLPTSMTAFSTEGVGQTIYDIADITVTDNILGKDYVVDPFKSTAEKLVLTLEKNDGFVSAGTTPNEKAVGAYLDRFVESDNYNLEEYLFLDILEDNLDFLDLQHTTGELHASTVGFMYLNGLKTTQSLFDILRNNALVAYSGESSVAPMDYGASNYPNNYGSYGGAAGGAFDNGQLYYNTDTNSYGPGVVPIETTGASETYPMYQGGVYNGETYGSGVGGMSGGSYYPPEGTPYEGGNYNFSWLGPREKSTLRTMRAQAQYGDPGTLIYSAWFAALGGSPDAKVHKQALSYNGKYLGFLAGLDLFCSCDCRFGAYYGFQHNELRNIDELGKLKTNNHMLGLYHQFGDETIYNIANVRGGFDRYKTIREINVLDYHDRLSAKYHGWNLGASFERGANFAAKPFVFSPYASLDYNFLFRNKFTETSTKDSGFALHGKKSNYHSLRGQVGGRVALDMYPGDQQLRVVGRAAYIHEFFDAMYGKTVLNFADMTNAPGSFDVHGNSLGRDWALLGIGVDWTPVPALVLFLKGDYLVNKYISDPWATAGLKYRW